MTAAALAAGSASVHCSLCIDAHLSFPGLASMEANVAVVPAASCHDQPHMSTPGHVSHAVSEMLAHLVSALESKTTMRVASGSTVPNSFSTARGSRTARAR